MKTFKGIFSLSPVRGGEGWGEGRAMQLAEWPLTLTLSPEYRGEGTRKTLTL